jgi:hypothetical protein
MLLCGGEPNAKAGFADDSHELQRGQTGANDHGADGDGRREQQE